MEIFDYDNILLLPRKCRVDSRSECDPSIEFGAHRFKLPVVPANMKTVVDEPITEWLAANGYFYVMHRFDLDNAGLREADARQGPARLDQLGREAGRLPGHRPPRARGRGRRLHHHRHRARPCRQRAQDDRAHQAEAAQDLRDRRQRGHARGGDRPGELGRRRHQGRRRPGQGVHHQAEDRLRHRRLAALGAEVVRARGHQADHRRRRHPRPRRHRQERALRRVDGDDRLAVRRPRRVARADRRGRRQALQGVLRLGQRLQQGRVQARRGQAHPRADQGQARRHACARCARTCRARSATAAAPS